MLVEAGGCDHGWFLGNWCVARRLDRCLNGHMTRMRRESRIDGLVGIVCWLLTLDAMFCGAVERWSGLGVNARAAKPELGATWHIVSK